MQPVVGKGDEVLPVYTFPLLALLGKEIVYSVGGARNCPTV